MNISINFSGSQRQTVKTDRILVPISDKVRVVADLFNYIKDVYPELALNKEAVLVTVNSSVSSLDYRLNPDDEVAFMPHIGGG